MKIALASCYLEEVHKKSHSCIFQLARCPTHRFDEILTSPTAGADLSRSLIASEFLKYPDYEALFFVDDDIAFTPSDAVKLADQLSGGKEIIGGCYVVKGGKHNPSTRFFDGQTVEFTSSAKPVEVKYLAGGFMMIHRKVFEKLTQRVPLCHAGSKTDMQFYPFFSPFIKRARVRMGHIYEYLTEDFAFCDRAADSGFKIWCDPSIRLIHLGTKAFTLEDQFIEEIKPMPEIKVTKV